MTSEGIQVEIYKDSAPHVLVDVINARTSPTYLAELKNHGAGSFIVSKNDPKVKANPSLLDYRNFVRIRVNGTVVGGFIIQTKRTTIVSEGEYAGESWEVSGEGLRAWFKDASVYPAKGLSQASKETRFFNFASFRGSWYDAGQWQNPIAYEKWNSNGRKKTAPAEWPDAPNAYWIWGTAFTPPGTPGKSPDGRDHKRGFNYFRYEFNTTDSATTRYALFFGVDDRAEVYVDGELLMTTADHAWQETNRLDFDLDPGSHVIALKAYNYRDDGPGGVIGALFRYGDASIPTSARLISVTNATSGWKVCPYPAIEPGWTVGDILLTLLNEAEARGVRFAGNITPMFDESTDSAGLPWANPLPWEFEVGSSYSDVLSALEEAECDVYLHPDTLKLYAWNRRGYNRSKEGDFANAIIYTAGHNLFAAQETGQADITNRILMRTPGGWSEAVPTEGTSLSRYGRIESHFSTDLSGKAATNLVAEMFRQKALPEKSATFSIHVTDNMVPFENFDVGDWVSAPNDNNVQEARRVMSISVTENPATGEPAYAVEFDTIFKDRQTELENSIRRATGGSSTLSGFGPSVVKLPSTVIVGNPPPPFIEAKEPDAPIWVSVTAEGDWSASGLPVATVSLQWTPVSTSQGDPITDVERYELWARRATETQDVVIGTYTDTFATLVGVPSGTDWVYRVRAIGRVNGPGVFSPNYAFTTPFPVKELDPPSQPSLASDLSLVIVNWDGLLGGEVPPASFRRVFAEFRAGTTGAFTRVSGYATKAGQVATIRATTGTSVQVRLIAEDSLGRETDPSPVQSITVVGVGVPDIASDLADAIQDAVDTAQQLNNDLHGPGGLDETVTQLGADLAGVQSDLATVETDLATVETDLAGVQSDLSTVESTVTTVQSDLTTVQSDLTTVQSDLTTVQSDLATVETDLTTVQSDLTTVQSDLATVETDLTAVQSIAGTASSKADAALASSAAAQATADAKPGIFYSTSTPSGTAPSGSLWFRTNASGDVIGQWQQTAAGVGSTWTPRTLRNEVIANLDAGKINAGYLDAARIAALSITTDKLAANAVTADKIAANAVTAGKIAALAVTADKLAANAVTADKLAANAVTADKILANAVTADKLAANAVTAGKIAAGAVTAEKVVITDGANLFQSTYLLTGSGPVGLRNSIGEENATPYSGPLVAPTGGRLIQLNTRDHIADYRVPAKPGEEFYVEVVAKRIAGTKALNPNIAVFTASGGIPTGMAGWWSATTVRGKEMEDLGDGWYRVSSIRKVPETAANAALVAAYIQVDQFAPHSPEWIITDVALRRRAGGSLIVDGVITADKLASNSVTAGKIATNAVTADKILANAVTADKILANAVGADKLAANAVTAEKIVAGAVGTDKLAANAVTAGKIAIGDFTNLVSGSDFEDAARIPWDISAAGVAVGTDQAHSGTKSLRFDAGAGSTPRIARSLQDFEVRPGDQLYIELWVRRSASYNGTSSNSKLSIRKSGGWGLINSVGYGADIVTTPDDWTKITSTVTIPSGVSSIFFDLRADHTDGFVWIDDVVIRRMSGGELIVDGAITSTKVNTAELWANAAWIDAATVGVLRAGVIEVDMLSPSVGESLDISANGSVNIILDAQSSLFENVSANTEAAENAANLAAAAGDLAGVAQGDAAVAAEAAELARQAALAAQAAVEDISVYYRFTAEGAIIGRTDSPFQLRLANDRAEFTENGVVTTYWESGQMFVPELVSPIVTLGNHRIEKYGTRTVVRAV